MKILLITTPPNAVLSALGMLEDVELYIVDCSSAAENIHNRVSYAVESVLPDMIITYRCPYILPYDIFSQPRLGSYNIHPSLLPKHSGLNPWEKIMNDSSQMNGVTLHRISRHVDQGEKIVQRSYSIVGMSYECARKKADDIAGIMISDFIKQFSHFK